MFSSSDPAKSRRVRKLVREGLLKPLVPRAFTSNFDDELDVIIRRNWRVLVGQLYKGSQLAFKTALLYGPDADGNLFFQGRKRRPVSWPGLNLSFIEGEQPLSDDHPLSENLYGTSLERGMLENLIAARTVNSINRQVDRVLLEERLVDVLTTRGEEAIQSFRDRAREISEQFGWQKAFAQLNLLVSAVLGSGPSRVLVTDEAKARVYGVPYDSVRVDRFNLLQQYLLQHTWPRYEIPSEVDKSGFRRFAFYESYFSNFIEGTEFTVEEAHRIVFKGEDIAMQIEDCHDVRALYEICSARDKLKLNVESLEPFANQLREWHAQLLKKRPEKNPGKFKNRANRAGDTEFVLPQFVEGTLKKGLEILAGLIDPFARACFIMFFVSEVHPFDDGNGRMARLAMNASLSETGLSKIIIPTVYREDYLLGLRALTRRQDPSAYTRMLKRIWGYSASIPIEYDAEVLAYLSSTNSFRLSAEAAIVFPQGI